MSKKKTLTVMLLVFAASFLFVGLSTNALAQDTPPFFIDENGDGFNDNAPDHDGDGIPNSIDPDFRRMFKMNNSPIWNQLTEEQQQELQALIESMQDQDATREDIHNAVAATLGEWGIEAPENIGRGPGLNNEQRIQIRELTQTMRDQGASREDIRSAISDQLGEWGIEAPVGGPMAGPRQGERGHRRGRP
ncbi:MAG TPA: hypothetical protein ENN20_02440 [Candidatus Marinimicrobia bacterium]|nr:hypothetical protein [Candidatus Neomarinimicrobiota bacterium]